MMERRSFIKMLTGVPLLGGALLAETAIAESPRHDWSYPAGVDLTNRRRQFIETGHAMARTRHTGGAVYAIYTDRQSRYSIWQPDWLYDEISYLMERKSEYEHKEAYTVLLAIKGEEQLCEIHKRLYELRAKEWDENYA